VSRLHPSTNVNELVDCLRTVNGELSVTNIDCKKVLSKYEHLYVSNHATITVDSASFHQAIKLFTSAEVWPVGIFVRRYFKTRSEIQTKLTISTFECPTVKSSVQEFKNPCDNIDVLLLQKYWLLPNE
jgi:hypothetical protein